MRALRLCAILLTAAICLPSQDLKEFEKKVTEFTLANGLHFIVAERHEAPVVSFHTYVNAGSVDDPSGETGIAHMFEHMAFKGTETIGTATGRARRRPWMPSRRRTTASRPSATRGPRPTKPGSVCSQAQLKMAIDGAEAYVVPNEYLAHH